MMVSLPCPPPPTPHPAPRTARSTSSSRRGPSAGRRSQTPCTLRKRRSTSARACTRATSTAARRTRTPRASATGLWSSRTRFSLGSRRRASSRAWCVPNQHKHARRRARALPAWTTVAPTPACHVNATSMPRRTGFRWPSGRLADNVRLHRHQAWGRAGLGAHSGHLQLQQELLRR